MVQERQQQLDTARRGSQAELSSAFETQAHDDSELTEVELAQVAGGGKAAGFSGGNF
jgi:hypothetical protein